MEYSVGILSITHLNLCQQLPSPTAVAEDVAAATGVSRFQAGFFTLGLTLFTCVCCMCELCAFVQSRLNYTVLISTYYIGKYRF
jgi:hypothetical protein